MPKYPDTMTHTHTKIIKERIKEYTQHVHTPISFFFFLTTRAGDDLNLVKVALFYFLFFIFYGNKVILLTYKQRTQFNTQSNFDLIRIMKYSVLVDTSIPFIP